MARRMDSQNAIDWNAMRELETLLDKIQEEGADSNNRRNNKSLQNKN